jgi:hypothetical protein
MDAQPGSDAAAPEAGELAAASKPLQHCIHFRCQRSGKHVDDAFRKELLRMLAPALEEYAQQMKEIEEQRSGSSQRAYPPGV